jgi:NTP pyrophosphatase (non-canonical NTP hydrolase)
MIDLKQKELHDWQAKNFPRDRYEAMRKEELIDIIITLQVTLGMCEEVGEIAHAVLKGTQNIREGVDGIDKEKVGDGFGDVNIYGQQLMSELKLDAEKEIEKATNTVLARNWIKYPLTGINNDHPFYK